MLWVIGGMIGVGLPVLGWTGIILGVWALFELDASVATIGPILFGTAVLLGSVVGPLLDNTDSPVTWLFSFLIKWVQSPLLTTVGLVATLIVAIGGGTLCGRQVESSLPPSTSGHRRQRHPESVRSRSAHRVLNERVGCPQSEFGLHEPGGQL